MRQRVLAPDEILVSFEAVSLLYPHIPPMLIWRSWEYAAYQQYELKEPVLEAISLKVATVSLFLHFTR